MRVVFTGTRHAGDEADLEYVGKIVDSLFENVDRSSLVFVHGAGRGLDALVDRVAAERGIRVERHPADWARDGRAAGPKRNGTMARSHPDVGLAFPCRHSIGTWDCCRQLVENGVHVRIYPILCEQP